MDVDYGIKPIVLTRQQELSLDAFNESAQFGERPPKVVLNGLSFARQVHESLGVIHLL